ncbi:MAG TPA: hypothetical protein VJQ45_12260 [Ktedonobacterales bacterium]|nr:hypothetical protein [Ktedonobacterales bacterium]
MLSAWLTTSSIGSTVSLGVYAPSIVPPAPWLFGSRGVIIGTRVTCESTAVSGVAASGMPA